MRPLFSRLYDVLARSSVHQREDYLTEILAECLSHEAIAEQVLTHVLGGQALVIDESDADTQRTYRSAIVDRRDDRPDVTWRLETDDGGRWLVFIECKLKAPESGEDQLDRYARRLAEETADTDESPLLVYLTERADPREDGRYEQHGIRFEQTRWYRVHEVVDASEAGPDWLREALIDYIEEEDLDMSRTFQPEDLYAIRRSSAVFAIIDEALDGKVAKCAEDDIGAAIGDKSSRSTQIQNHDRYVSKLKLDGHDYAVLVGVSWQDRDFRDERDLPVATMILQCAPNHAARDAVKSDLEQIGHKQSGFTDEVQTSLNGWLYIERHTPLVDFLSDDDHVTALEDWWLGGLQELVDAADEGDAPYLDRLRPSG